MFFELKEALRKPQNIEKVEEFDISTIQKSDQASHFY